MNILVLNASITQLQKVLVMLSLQLLRELKTKALLLVLEQLKIPLNQKVTIKILILELPWL